MRGTLKVLALAAGVGIATVAPGAASSSPPAASPLEPLRFLVGTWRGEGSGTPGQGSGTATFAFELDGRVLVRRSLSDYPAAAGRPATVHEDLMVIHPAPGGHGLQAIDFDNEGHVIRYGVTLVSGKSAAVFESEPSEKGPRSESPSPRS